ncbi:MAG: hypothetical protein HYY18_23530 [Planctomycetes bacterium]|nr:hypothetical protein [Planctomycetota bacterium]
MRTLAFALLLALPCAAEPREGTIEDTWKGGKYLLYVPGSYQAADGLKWGLWVTMIPPDHNSADYVEVWQEHAQFGMFLSLVIEAKVPQGEIGSLVEKTVAEYGLSRHRIGMAGYAEGAPRAWRFLFENPGKLAALAAFQGEIPRDLKDAGKATPVALVYDKGCTYVKFADARAYEKRLNEHGYDVKFFELNRGDHRDEWPAAEMRDVLLWVRDKGNNRAADLLKSAQALLDEGHPGRALAVLESILSQGVGEAESPVLAEMGKKIGESLKAELKKAGDAAAAGEMDAAGAALTELGEEYAGTAKAAAVEAELKRLSTDPKFQAALEARQKARKEEAARAEFPEAEAFEAERKWKLAVDAWKRIAAEHAGTEAAKEAAGRAEKIASDPAVRKELADAEAASACRKLMQMGDAFVKNRLVDKARAKYEEIVKKYPGTSFAEEAQRKIEGLK